MVAVLEGDEALGNLEEVAVWLVRSKVDIEDEGGVGRKLFLSRQNFERIFDHLTSSLVQNRQQGPVDVDGESELVLERELF